MCSIDVKEHTAHVRKTFTVKIRHVCIRHARQIPNTLIDGLKLSQVYGQTLTEKRGHAGRRKGIFRNQTATS